MIRRWLFVPLFAAVLLAQTPKKSSPRPLVQLLIPGTFHQGEGFRSGPGWIGLVPSSDSFAWSKFSIIAEKVHDEIADAPGKGKTATRISIQPTPSEAPLVLLRGLPQLANKPVQTCFDRRETGNLLEQNPILLTCEAQAYSVRVSNPRKDAEPGAASELILSHGGKSQVLYRWPEGLYDQNAELIWAGDLDGDGKLDLLINHSASSNVGGLSLYLSTWAAPGQKVGRVATFKTVGC